MKFSCYTVVYCNFTEIEDGLLVHVHWFVLGYLLELSCRALVSTYLVLGMIYLEARNGAQADWGCQVAVGTAEDGLHLVAHHAMMSFLLFGQKVSLTECSCWWTLMCNSMAFPGCFGRHQGRCHLQCVFLQGESFVDCLRIDYVRVNQCVEKEVKQTKPPLLRLPAC